MLNKKLGKLVAVSVLMVSAIAGSISAGAVAKTRVVQLKEGECYTLPKKSCNITIKNKKVIKLLKGRKLKAVKKGKCKVSYVRKGKKFSYRLVVTKRVSSNAAVQQTSVPEIMPSPVATPVVTQSSTPSEKPKSTPWGTVSRNICNLVITKIEPGDNENEKVVYCNNLGDEYECTGPIIYIMRTSKLVCTVPASCVEQLKVGDYACVVFYGRKINNVIEDGDTTTITGLSDIYKDTPVKKTDVKPTSKPSPEATESWTLKYYVCDIMDDVLYLSESRSYKYNARINKKVINDGTIFYKGRTVSKEELQIGDYISVNVNGSVGYSASTISHVEKIVINERHPEVIGKKYAYTVTEKNGPVYKVTDEYGEVFTENHEMVLGFDKCRFYCDGEEITYDDMNIGDTVYLYTDDGHTCDPLTQVSVAKVIVVHKK